MDSNEKDIINELSKQDKDFTTYIEGITPTSWKHRQKMTPDGLRKKAVILRDMCVGYDPRCKRVIKIRAMLDLISIELAEVLKQRRSGGPGPNKRYVGNYVDSSGKGHLTTVCETIQQAMQRRRRLSERVEFKIQNPVPPNNINDIFGNPE